MLPSCWWHPKRSATAQLLNTAIDVSRRGHRYARRHGLCRRCGACRRPNYGRRPTPDRSRPRSCLSARALKSRGPEAPAQAADRSSATDREGTRWRSRRHSPSVSTPRPVSRCRTASARWTGRRLATVRRARSTSHWERPKLDRWARVADQLGPVSAEPAPASVRPGWRAG